MHIEIHPVEGGRCPTYTGHIIDDKDEARVTKPCSLSAIMDWLITSGCMHELKNSVDAGFATHE